MMTETTVSALVNELKQQRTNSGRLVLALAGPPASGKSTLANVIVEDLGQSAAVLPMDGFHLDNKILHARGLFERKGAPETFDAAGFVALMRKVRAGDHVTYPIFDRENDCTVPDEGEIAKETKFIVVEGNYLLLNSEPWSELTELFDVTVRLDVPRGELQKRLIARWIDHGLSLQKARERALGNDMVNADYVLNNSRAADFVIRASA